MFIASAFVEAFVDELRTKLTETQVVTFWFTVAFPERELYLDEGLFYFLTLWKSMTPENKRGVLFQLSHVIYNIAQRRAGIVARTK